MFRSVLVLSFFSSIFVTSAEAGKRVRTVYQAAPAPVVQYYLVPAPQPVAPRVYYQPAPAAAPAQVQTGYQDFSRGNSQYQSGGVNSYLNYNRNSGGYCTHGPNGSTCTDGYDVNSAYGVSSYSKPVANGEYKYRGGDTRNYTHGGSLGEIANILYTEQNRENYQRQRVNLIERIARMEADLERMRNVVQAKYQNGQVSYATYSAVLQDISETQRAVEDVKSEMRRRGIL